MTAFDVVGHHRERSRRAERRADHLERERARLERLLALALRIATGDGRDAQPLALLAVLEEFDRRSVEQTTPTVDELLALLRETNPNPPRGARG